MQDEQARADLKFSDVICTNRQCPLNVAAFGREHLRYEQARGTCTVKGGMTAEQDLLWPRTPSSSTLPPRLEPAGMQKGTLCFFCCPEPRLCNWQGRSNLRAGPWPWKQPYQRLALL